MLLRPIFKFIDLLRADAGPSAIAGGVVLGMWLGLMPPLTLQWPLLAIAALLLRVNILAVLFSSLLFHLGSTFVDPLFHSIGYKALVTVPPLQPLLARLYHAPVVPFTQFNDTVVLGTLIVGTVATLPIFFVIRTYLKKRYEKLQYFFRYHPIWNTLNNSELSRAYAEYISYIQTKRQLKRYHSGLSRIFRWKGFLVVTLALIIITVSVPFFFEDTARQQLELIATKVNGAKVDIGSLETNILRGTLEAKDIQITHHVRPMRNLFQIDKVSLNFRVDTLFRRKFLVDNLSVDGVQYGTPRTTSGQVPGSALNFGVPSLIDRVATGAYSDARQAFKTNPLKFLGKLSAGFHIGPKIDTIRSEFQIIKQLAQYQRELHKISGIWETERENIPRENWLNYQMKVVADLKNATATAERKTAVEQLQKIRIEVDAKLAYLNRLYETFEEKFVFVQRGLAELETNLSSDIKLAKTLLGLPRLDEADLSHHLFGPKIMNYLERLSYWIDLTRRKMPKGDRVDGLTIVQNARGAQVHFEKSSAFPEILISNGVITSSAETGPNSARLNGTMRGLTNEPSVYQYPFLVELKADFPTIDAHGIIANMSVDHTHQRFTENISLYMRSFKVKDLVLYNQADLDLRIKSAIANTEFDAYFEDDEMTLTGFVNFDDVEFDVKSRYNYIENIIRSILDPVYSFKLNTKVSGKLDDLNVTVSSQLGKALAHGLQEKLRNQLSAIDDSVEQVLVAQIAPERRRITERLRQVSRNTLDRLISLLSSTKKLAHSVDRALSTLGAGPTRDLSSKD